VADAECSSPTDVLANGVKNPDDPFDTKREVSGTERVHCLDATDGHELWKYEYHCPYQISYPAGPRCTPTVHDGKVYTLGAMGDLFCSRPTRVRSSGRRRTSRRNYAARVPTWAIAGHPLVYKNLLVCVVVRREGDGGRVRQGHRG